MKELNEVWFGAAEEEEDKQAAPQAFNWMRGKAGVEPNQTFNLFDCLMGGMKGSCLFLFFVVGYGPEGPLAQPKLSFH